MVDETNNPGSRTDGKYYIFGATVIDSNDLDGFGKIKDDDDHNERKFNTKKHLRNDVLDEIREYCPRLYAVTVKIPRSKKWNHRNNRMFTGTHSTL